MTRTQIQLPDDVYARARKVCDSREISLAELARRGLEYILSVYEPAPGSAGDWHPRKPRKLGWRGLSDAMHRVSRRYLRAAAGERGTKSLLPDPAPGSGAVG
jgi:hypothetical protein